MSSEFSDGLQWLIEIDFWFCQIRSCSQRIKTLILLFPFPIIKTKYFLFIYPNHSLFRHTSNQKSWSAVVQVLHLGFLLTHSTTLLYCLSPHDHSHMLDMLVQAERSLSLPFCLCFLNPLCITLRYFIGRAERH